jgi:hypothetical protein
MPNGEAHLSVTVCVPWLFRVMMTLWKDRARPRPVVFVRADFVVEVPASLGDRAADAVSSAFVDVVERRGWLCGGGVSALPKEDEDDWCS